MNSQQLPLILLLFVRLLISCGQPEDNYRWEEHQNSWYLIKDDIRIGELVPFNSKAIETKDEIIKIKDGVFRIIRTCRNPGAITLDSVSVTLDFIHLSPTDYNLIPAVSYNGNNWGRGKEPKGFKSAGEHWSFSSLRMSIPGATYSEGNNYAVALWGEFMDKKTPFACSIMPGEDRTVHRLIWPQEEIPLSYTRRDQYSDGFREYMAIPPGELVTLQANIVIDRVKPNHKSISTFLAEAWEYSEKGITPVQSPDEIWDHAIAYTKNDLWAEEGDFRGFSIGMIWSDDQWIQRPGWKYEIGWCGQNASLANSLLVNFLKTGDLESKEKAVLCLDTWAKHSPLPNGLFRTHFDYILGITQGQEVLDACNLGTAALNFFEAFELAGKCGLKRPKYREIALNICEFMVLDQEETGRYGKGWTTGGECLFREGTIGAFLIPPML